MHFKNTYIQLDVFNKLKKNTKNLGIFAAAIIIVIIIERPSTKKKVE